MRSQPSNFFHRVNLLFVGLLCCFCALLAGSLFVPGTSLSHRSTTQSEELVVRGESTGREVRERNAWWTDSFIPVAQANPQTEYTEMARDRTTRTESWSVTAPPAVVLLYVLPVMLAVLALWPLALALQARNWFVGLCYLAVMALACAHAWNVTWRHFPYDLHLAQSLDGTPVWTWLVFLMLALCPRGWRDSSEETFRQGQTASGILLVAALTLLVPLAIADAGVETFSERKSKRMLIRPAGDARTFRLADIDLGGIPAVKDTQSHLWQTGPDVDTGTGSSSRRTSLAGAVLAALAGAALVTFLTMLPCRILVRKGRAAQGQALVCIVMLLGVASLPLAGSGSIHVANLAPWVAALACAWLARPMPGGILPAPTIRSLNR